MSSSFLGRSSSSLLDSPLLQDGLLGSGPFFGCPSDTPIKLFMGGVLVREGISGVSGGIYCAGCMAYYVVIDVLFRWLVFGVRRIV